MPVKSFTTTPGPLKRCNRAWSDVSMRALIQVEHILSICCERRLDILCELNTCSIWNVCTVNVLCNLSITFYKVKAFVVERDIPIKLKHHSSSGIYFSLFSYEQLTLEVCPHVLGTPIYIIYTGCFTTCGHYCRRWFPRSLWSKSSYKHMSYFGRLRNYDRLKLRIEDKDYWQ
jgi:hypothetical protein